VNKVSTNSTPDTRTLVTIRQAADYLGVKPWNVFDLTERGAVPFMKLHGVRFVAQEDLSGVRDLTPETPPQVEGPTGPVGMLRDYLSHLPENLRYVHRDLADARCSAKWLLPFVWRVTAADEQAPGPARRFRPGPRVQRDLAELQRSAPAVGGVFRTAREAMGLSLVEVATRVGVEPDHLERVELGEEVAPQSFTTRLAETLAELMTSRIAATP
jgi:hypothetical protein